MVLTIKSEVSRMFSSQDIYPTRNPTTRELLLAYTSKTTISDVEIRMYQGSNLFLHIINDLATNQMVPIVNSGD